MYLVRSSVGLLAILFLGFTQIPIKYSELDQDHPFQIYSTIIIIISFDVMSLRCILILFPHVYFSPLAGPLSMRVSSQQFT